MLQIQAPAEVLRLLQSSASVVADAKTIKDVQDNVRLVAQELEAKPERLASCLSGITGDLDGVKHQTERLLNVASDHHVAFNNANGKFKELAEQIQQIESAVTHMSRRQLAFESTMETRLGALENQIIQLQAQATSADALRDEVASMKAALSSLEHQQPNIQQSAQIKSEESETRIQRRMDEMDVLLKHFSARVDGNEKRLDSGQRISPAGSKPCKLTLMWGLAGSPELHRVVLNLGCPSRLQKRCIMRDLRRRRMRSLKRRSIAQHQASRCSR